MALFSFLEKHRATLMPPPVACVAEPEVPEALAEPVPVVTVQQIAVSLLDADPDQPRKTFDGAELACLGQSLKKKQLHPLRVRPLPDGRYMVISGGRRLAAAQQVELPYLDCIVVDGLDPKTIKTEQLIDDLHSVRHRPIENGQAMRDLLDGTGLDQRGLAELLDVSMSTISKALSLLRSPEPVRELVAAGSLPASTAYELKDLPAEEQVEVAQLAAAENWSRSQVQAHVAQLETGQDRPSRVDTTEQTLTWKDFTITVYAPRQSSWLELAEAMEGAAGLIRRDLRPAEDAA